MNADEVMLACPLVLQPGERVGVAITKAGPADIDIIPIVSADGTYVGSVAKDELVRHASETARSIDDLCCTDAILCAPGSPLEALQHDATSAVPHRTIMVVDDNGKFHGVVPWVHWAVDEAKVQSGHPRSPLEVRSYAMHLLWKCLECGETMFRNSGTPNACPGCGAGPNSFALHTED